MNYEIGSVADLISGTITPNRPKLNKRALTPTKHKKSPNVTPKSEPLVDRSMFLSPSLQRKKAIVKKSPKRIFQDENVEVKESEKKLVKKHLVDQMNVSESSEIPERPKKRKSTDLTAKQDLEESNSAAFSEQNENTPKKKKKKGKVTNDTSVTKENSDVSDSNLKGSPKKKAKHVERQQSEDKSDSDHASDNEIESENEQKIKELAEEGIGTNESGSDEEKSTPVENNQNRKEDRESKFETDPDEIKRTIFVGNVPLNKKTKKELKKIFLKYGNIESVRIRNVPVKDSRLTPKLAIIKNETHPDKTTVNCYIKFEEAESVDKALVENNRQLGEHHLRVDRSDTTGDVNDTRKTLFVGNIPLNMQDEAFRSLFTNCGEIESVRIIRDRKTQLGKGVGFVNFKSVDGVELALMMDEKDITVKNRILRLKRYSSSAPKKQKVNAKSTLQGKKDNVGAFKRINDKKRKLENQTPNNNGEPKVKKDKKEFVGMTANAKKKKKVNKGLKKQKKLSKILTNNS